jgi:phospholipase A1/A2
MIKTLLFISLFVTALMATTAYEEAYKVYKEGKYKESLVMFTKLVKENKDNDAAYILGYMYEHGEGCEIDMQKSMKYYRLSSRGYYYQGKVDPTRDVDKEQRKLYDSLHNTDNTETQSTIKQYVESLYNIKAHNTNYFLPLSARVDGNEYAKTGTGASAHRAKKVETEFQVSLKYNITANLLGLGEIYTVAYTQHSFWQLYVESAYFRETNYNPEFFITVPIPEFKHLEFLKAIRVGFAHQSNGRGGFEERSWNYFYATTYFQYKSLFSELKLWTSWSDALTYNPDLLDYLGSGELKFSLPYQKHLMQLKLRCAFNEHYAAELNYSYPLFGRDDLFLYVKGFSGYGESLIDYNHEVQKIGIGFSISR